MSKRVQLFRPPAPGALRLTLVATSVGVGAVALCRHTPVERWIAGAAGLFALALLIWWRGLFGTEAVGKWLSMRVRRLSDRASPDLAQVVRTGVNARSAVALELEPPAGPSDLDGPALLGLLAGYLDRYGVSCSAIRVTTAHIDGADARSWVSLTLSAADNLVALRARSPQIPLQETAATVRRRLADHLRELGWQVRATEHADAPLTEPVEEGWRAVADERGHLAAYRIAVNEDLPSVLQSVRGAPLRERWTALELSGTPQAPRLSVVCALRTDDKPAARAPLTGLAPCRGEQLRVLRALHPLAASSLGGEAAPVAAASLDRLCPR